MEKLYTCEEVAERYSVKAITVLEWIRQKKLSAINLGKGYRIQESDLLEFEQSNKTTNTTNTDTEE